MNRFVRPDETTLTLTHGDTITIRRELTHGERIAALQRSYVKDPDGTWRRDPLLSGMAVVTAYLLDWTFKGEHDVRMPIKGLSLPALTDVLNALQSSAWVEIKDAIEAHEAQVARENALPEELPPSARISTSRVDAGGGTSGFATSMKAST
jgi:hypothetical protein